MTPAGIEPATFRFVAQHLNHCPAAVPKCLCIHSEYYRVSKHWEIMRNYDEIFSVEEITIRHFWRLKGPCELCMPSVRASWRSKGRINTEKRQVKIFQTWHSQTNPTYPVLKQDMTSCRYLRYTQCVLTFVYVQRLLFAILKRRRYSVAHDSTYSDLVHIQGARMHRSINLFALYDARAPVIT